MRYEWDEAKRQANLAKHGVDFADEVGVFFDDYALTRQDPDSTDENRLCTLGLGLNLRVLYVVWVERVEDGCVPHHFRAQGQPRRNPPVSGVSHAQRDRL